jgi:hypothetical protein
MINLTLMFSQYGAIHRYEAFTTQLVVCRLIYLV